MYRCSDASPVCDNHPRCCTSSTFSRAVQPIPTQEWHAGVYPLKCVAHEGITLVKANGGSRTSVDPPLVKMVHLFSITVDFLLERSMHFIAKMVHFPVKGPLFH